MGKRQYDVATAKSLMEFAFPGYAEHELKPYEIREDGVYVTEALREECPPGTIFDWTPADEMHWPGAPRLNPDTAPFLPIPFDAAQLAAAMIDGAGQCIANAVGYHLGSLPDSEALDSLPARKRWIREALAEAYELAASAQSLIGAFDHQAEVRARDMSEKYVDAKSAANQREGVFEVGITEEERRARRERATTYVLPLKMAADEARDACLRDWQRWRTAMVRQLLDSQPQKLGKV